MNIEPAEDGDMALIYDAWLNGQRVTPLYEWFPEALFFRLMSDRIARLVTENTTLVARPSDKVGEDGKKDIAGFVCGRRDDSAPIAGPCPVIVHWIFVKANYRVRGFDVARRLLRALGWEEGFPIGATGWSDVCETAIPGTLLFVPSLLNNKPAKKAA